MTKQQLLKKIETAWTAFKDSYLGLSDEKIMESGVTGDWSVKDIIAHVTLWEDEALKHLPHILKGERSPRYSVTYGGIDAFNALMTERKKGLTLAEVLREQDETHRRLLAYIAKLPDEQFTTETRIRRRIRLDGYSHYPIHAKAIREWRAKNTI